METAKTTWNYNVNKLPCYRIKAQDLVVENIGRVQKSVISERNGRIVVIGSVCILAVRHPRSIKLQRGRVEPIDWPPSSRIKPGIRPKVNKIIAAILDLAQRCACRARRNAMYP